MAQIYRCDCGGAYPKFKSPRYKFPTNALKTFPLSFLHLPFRSILRLPFRFRLSLSTGDSAAMSTAEMEQLTSGASNRIIPLLKSFRTSLLFIHTVFLSLLFFVFPRRRRCLSESLSESTAKRQKSAWRREEEDTIRRRALAEGLNTGDGYCQFRRDTFLFYGVRQSALFCRSWFPVSGNPR